MYRMNNPVTSRTFRTLAEAKFAAHAGLDSIAARRGYSMTESKRREGSKVLHYITVLDSKGRVKTGVVIYKMTGEEQRQSYKRYTPASTAKFVEARKQAAARKERAKVTTIQQFAQRYGSWGCEDCGWVYLPPIDDDNACAAGHCTG